MHVLLRCTLAAILAVAAAMQAAAQSPGTVHFGNLEFEPGDQWIIGGDSQALLMTPKNAAISNAARVRVGPVESGTAQNVLSRLWASVSSGKQVNGELIHEDDAFVSGTGTLYRENAFFSDGSAAYVWVAESGGKLTPFVLTADNRLAADLSAAFFTPVLMSMRGNASLDPSETPMLASDQGADPYDSIPWEGPKDWAYGVYDIKCISPKLEFQQVMQQSRGLVGSVKPAAATFAQAMARVRAMAEEPGMSARYAQYRKLNAAGPGVLQGAAFAEILANRPILALLELLAVYEGDPKNADNGFNLAALMSSAGMANESLAVLNEMERQGKKPNPALVDGVAAMEYLRGYDQLLLGQTADAKAHLRKAMELEPFLKEAAIALAIAEAAVGDAAAGEETYALHGVWRRKPSETVSCGASRAVGKKSGKKRGEGPDDGIRPPITDMLDVSKGLPGVLPAFHHPLNGLEAHALSDRYEGEVRKMINETHDLALYVSALGTKLGARKTTPIEAWYRELEWLGILLQREPPVGKLQQAKERAGNELAEAVDRINKRSYPEVTRLLSQPGDHEKELEDIASHNVSSLRPFAQAYELSVRRLFRVTNRYTTGLAAQYGDHEWHEHAMLSVKLDQDGEWINVMGASIGSYLAVVDFLNTTPADAESNKLAEQKVPECPDGLRNFGFKVTFENPIKLGPDFKVALKANCNKLTAELAVYPLRLEGFVLDAAGGGFGQVEVEPGHGTTVFVGATGKVGVGEEEVMTAGVTLKEGVYVQTNGKGQVSDMGVKATGEVTVKLGKNVQLSDKIVEGKISFFPSPSAPSRGPDLLAPYSGP